MRVPCSRRSDSGARAKNKASERAGKKNEGRLGKSLPSFFPALSLALCFARAPQPERVEQATMRYIFIVKPKYLSMITTNNKVHNGLSTPYIGTPM